MKQHLKPKKISDMKAACQLERNLEVPLLKNHKMGSAQNWMFFVTGF